MVMAGGLLSLMSDYISGDYHEGPLSGIIIESGFCQGGYYLYPMAAILPGKVFMDGDSIKVES